MIRKILKWTGIVLLVLIAGILLTVAARQHRHFEAPYPNIKSSNDSAVIARGKHLVLGPAHCVACHSTAVDRDSLIQADADVPLSGGFPFTFGLGTFYSRNITPDSATGIGNLTDRELARIMRYGVHKNGESVLPFMSYQNMSDDDLRAIISYLRTTKPVHNEVPDHDVNLMGNVVRAFLLEPVGPAGEVPHDVPCDTTAAYGKYLVTKVAQCGGCHSQHDETGKILGAELAGGTPMTRPGSTVALAPPNLTPDSSSRIFGWSQDDFVKRFRMGQLNPHSEMPWPSFSRMTDEELKAIYQYLKTVKPAKAPALKI
jgi:mono/diheme cytochrome c family protein